MLDTKTLAPIVLFTYNRLYHTKQTVEALAKNKLAKQSELFIYSDCVKDISNIEAKKNVDEVREYIKTLENKQYFKSVTIVERTKNWGLADSIIDGVTDIVNKYGKIIVLEDDIVTSPYFLEFMNNALEYYQNQDKVWHISGWNYPIETNGLDDVFLWRLMNCWGWATWSDRWQYFEKNVDHLLDTFSKKDIKIFNLDGADDQWGQILRNKSTELNTWAVFWYASIFQQNGLCLNASKTYVLNIGLDGSGDNCDNTNCFNGNLNMKDNVNFGIDLSENKLALQKIIEFYNSQKVSLLSRVINKLSRIILKKNIL